MDHHYRTLCRIESPSALIDFAQDVVRTDPLQHLCGPLERLKTCGKSLVLYGGGRFAQSVIAEWQRSGLAPAWCVDSNSELHGTTVRGIPIRSPEELLPVSDSIVLVVAAMHTTQIHRWLRSHHLPHLFAELDGSVGCLPGHHLITRASEFEKVWTMLDDRCSRRVLLAVAKARLFQDFWLDMIGSPFLHAVAVGSQYFVPDFYPYDDRNTYVDCGAYEGDFLVSLERELFENGGGALRAHAFEPDSVNMGRLRKTLLTYGLDGVTVHHCLVGQEDVLVEYPDFHNCRASVSTSPVRMVRLDTVLAQLDVGFMKLDVEGSEIEALLGAQQTVKARQPHLAVCAYHKTGHLLDVPLTISAIAPNYALQMRHHSANTLWETVCYACPV